MIRPAESQVCEVVGTSSTTRSVSCLGQHGKRSSIPPPNVNGRPSAAARDPPVGVARGSCGMIANATQKNQSASFERSYRGPA
jgi:hypothetical protein